MTYSECSKCSLFQNRTCGRPCPGTAPSRVCRCHPSSCTCAWSRSRSTGTPPGTDSPKAHCSSTASCTTRRRSCGSCRLSAACSLRARKAREQEEEEKDSVEKEDKGEEDVKRRGVRIQLRRRRVLNMMRKRRKRMLSGEEEREEVMQDK